MAKVHAKSELKKATPKGHFVVYVGKELTRFAIPTSFLKNPNFRELLDEAAQEYDYCSHRGIVLPCDELTFREVMNLKCENPSN